jgi:F-type H+-transporting ATPase subunit gamma
MDRATAATAYTDRVTQLVSDLAKTGLEVSHPLLEARPQTERVTLLVLTANRGLCGGYNGNLLRAGLRRWQELSAKVEHCQLEVSGKRGIGGFKFRGYEAQRTYTQFEDKPAYGEVDEIASHYLDEFLSGGLDRLDVVYTRFDSIARQEVTTETLLPLSSLIPSGKGENDAEATAETTTEPSQYEFLPSPESILEEVVPTSFKVKLFKCFLDAAVSEQVARMVAMKSATESADDLIKRLSMQYNRARQSRITSELMDLIGGVEALN